LIRISTPKIQDDSIFNFSSPISYNLATLGEGSDFTAEERMLKIAKNVK